MLNLLALGLARLPPELRTLDTPEELLRLFLLLLLWLFLFGVLVPLGKGVLFHFGTGMPWVHSLGRGALAHYASSTLLRVLGSTALFAFLPLAAQVLAGVALLTLVEVLVYQALDSVAPPEGAAPVPVERLVAVAAVSNVLVVLLVWGLAALLPLL